MGVLLLSILLCVIWQLRAQPMTGGGGGGGFGGGGYAGGGLFGDGFSNTRGPACPYNCAYCSSDNSCSRCKSGYALSYGQCRRCARNCDNCDYAGADLCDRCLARHTLIQQQCEPCAPNCHKCDGDGPQSCDRCDNGFALRENGDQRVCDACTAGCKVCTNTGHSGCKECFEWYALEGGSCEFRAFFVAFLFALGCVFLWFLYNFFRNLLSRRPGSRGAPRHNLETHLDYVLRSPSFSEDAPAATALPSGIWRGYYKVRSIRHDVCEFNLTFSGEATVVGEGTDDIGSYRISGRYGGGHLAFAKTYDPRSRNNRGVVHAFNKGHTVEYRGKLAGASLGSGFRGNWYVPDEPEGEWHLWPAMEGWADVAEDSAASDDRRFEECECVVCYDRAISTRLRPCGHVALCSLCATRVRQRGCPLCRTPISSIENHVSTQSNDPLHED